MVTGNPALYVETAQPGTNQKIIKEIRELLRHDSVLCTHSVARMGFLSPSAVPRIVQDCLFLYPYNLRNVQVLLDVDKKRRPESPKLCLSHRDGAYNTYQNCFSDECV